MPHSDQVISLSGKIVTGVQLEAPCYGISENPNSTVNIPMITRGDHVNGHLIQVLVAVNMVCMVTAIAVLGPATRP